MKRQGTVAKWSVGLILALSASACLAAPSDQPSQKSQPNMPDMDPATAADFGFAKSSGGNQETQTLVNDGGPISLPLSVGQERRLIFEQPVQVGIDPALSGKIKPEVNANNVLLTVTEAIPVTRIRVRELGGGVTYLLDLHVSEQPGWTAPARIVNAHALTPRKTTTALPQQALAKPQRPGYLALTRYAAQQLYAPTRLIEAQPGITRTPVTHERVRLLRYASVDAEPLASWQASGLYLTAVKLTNRLRKPLTLDPRDLLGRWHTATFQHTRLMPKGSTESSTAVYLVSDQPFEAALGLPKPISRTQQEAVHGLD